MGRQDLGRCVVMSGIDANKLGIKLQGLYKIEDSRTPSINCSSFFDIKKRLLKYIERRAKKKKQM